MKIAIPVCGDRVSTVLDAADELLIIEDGARGARIQTRASWKENNPIGRILQLRDLDIDVLICGAVVRPMARMLETAGIRVIAYVRGTADEVFEAFHNGNLDNRRFFLPGCAPCERGSARGRHCQREINTGGNNKTHQKR